jgi:hypothetical protein
VATVIILDPTGTQTLTFPARSQSLCSLRV